MTDNAPERMTPEPEHMDITVFAGRGQELHGVPMTGGPDLHDTVDEREDELVMEFPADADPIPVKIVRGKDRQIRRARTFHTFAGTAQPQQILTKDPTRVSARIKSLSADPTAIVFLSGEQNTASAVHGYPISPVTVIGYAEFVWTSDEPLFAIVDPLNGNLVELAVLIEYIVTEN